MLLSDLNRVIAMFAFTNPKSDRKEAQGVRWDGSQWIVASEFGCVLFEPTGFICDHTQVNFLSADSLQFLKALAKVKPDREGYHSYDVLNLMTFLPNYCNAPAWYQEQRKAQDSLEYSFDLKALNALNKSMGLNRSKHKNIITLRFGHDQLGPILYRNSEGNEGLLMPCRVTV